MTDIELRRAAIKHAIEVAGGIQPFCAGLGVTHQAVYSYVKKGYMPAQRAVAIEKLGWGWVIDVVDPSVAAAFASMSEA